LNSVRDVSKELQLIPKMSGFLDALTIVWRTRHLGKYGLFSLKRVIDWHIKDPLLKIILNSQCGDHGLPPSKASFPLHCAVMEHYFSGGYYPKGGGSSIVDAMSRVIKKYNGDIRTKAQVKSILLDVNESKKAIGVELTNGEKIYANKVLSNADPSKTYFDLVGKEHLSKKLLTKLEQTIYSCTSLMLFLTVDMDVKSAGLDSGNIWVIPNRDMDDVYEEMMSSNIESNEYFSGLFISCTTLKDPTSFDGKHHVLEVITYVSYEPFEKFKDEKKRRSDEYLELKERLTNKMINSLDRVIPNIKDCIVHKNLATPITNEHYINATNGCVYGTQKSLNQIGPNSFKPQSEIENLYLCGASILSHGVAGASHSGVQTAARILNCKQEDLIKPNANQKVTILEN
ncbi:MAG: NAD(P)/FAD-dependent oxidoreductase, partial [Campylobacterota bacterium]|nr:NAD(P)/FAD-dependent oxidoreductase [Campylobacterota bacterium]